MKMKYLLVLAIVFALIFKFTIPVKALKEIIYSFNVSSSPLTRDWLFYVYDLSKNSKPMGGMEICLEPGSFCDKTDLKYGEVGWMGLPIGSYHLFLDIPVGYKLHNYYKVPNTYNNVNFYLELDQTPTPTPTLTPSPRPTPKPMPIIRVCDKRFLYCPVLTVK
jgi:hypothetical protein